MRRASLKCFSRRLFSPQLGLALAISVLTAPRSVPAAPPWQKLAVFHKVDADPAKDYKLSDDAGPWLILAYTFSGDEAEKQAHELVLELRRRFKLRAFTHEMEFDFRGEVQGLGVDERGQPKKMRYSRSGDFREIAVMVGDYTAVDDVNAQKTIDMLRFAEPDCLVKRDVNQISSRLAGFRAMQKQVLSDNNEKKKRGPLGRAFLVTNPLLPRDFYVPKGPDKLVLEMNRGVRHSLLDCPGKYTVKVATFTGAVIIDQKTIKEAEKGKPVESRLADAADKAHRLTEALRAQGVQAFEFHDRYSSLVTVGHFDSPGLPRQDGKIEINPIALKIIETYAAPKTPGGAASGGVKAKSLAGIPFDPQPMLVEVPHKLLSSDYEPTLLGRK